MIDEAGALVVGRAGSYDRRASIWLSRASRRSPLPRSHALRGTLVPHRKTEPEDEDQDTMAMREAAAAVSVVNDLVWYRAIFDASPRPNGNVSQLRAENR